MFVSKIRAEGAGADDRSPFGDFWFSPIGASSQAGIRVTGDAALRLSTVYRCVRVLAGTMARLPRCLTKPGEDPRGRDQVKGHWLSRLLRKPNRWQNGFEWHEMMVGHIALRGTGYNRIVANTSGEIEQLQPLHPDRMQAVLLRSGAVRYTYTHDDGTEEQLPDSMVFKISGFSANGVTGLSVISYARESIGEGLAQQDYSSRFFANDAQPSGGWIEYPGNFRDKAARDAFRMSWQEAQGRHNRGKTAVLENGMKFHEIGATNKDSQFLEAKNAKVADICRWFGVPLHLAFALDRATDNNVEQFGIEFRAYTMAEWAERFECAIEDQLLGEADQDLELEYDMDGLERGDMAARAAYLPAMVSAGILMRNEARILEGKNPMPGLDAPLEPLNMAPAGSRSKPGKAKPDQADNKDADEADARARELELAIAGRVVRKEILACRKAITKQGQTNVSLKTWLAEFYGEHVDYVVESLLCSLEAAAAWCDRQRAELEAELERLDSRGAEERMLELLEAWDASAAAELAARVRSSTEKK